MTAQLEGNNAELMIKLAALDGIVSQAQSGGGEPPGLAGHEGLKITVAAMEEQFRDTLPKIVGIDETQNNVQRKLLDMPCDFEKIKVEMVEQMSRVETFVAEGFASLQHTAAAAAQQHSQAASDPRDVDPFTVHGDDWSRRRKAAKEVYGGTPLR